MLKGKAAVATGSAGGIGLGIAWAPAIALPKTAAVAVAIGAFYAPGIYWAMKPLEMVMPCPA
jgi:hypothetical protein